jgi:hypothetical protein
MELSIDFVLLCITTLKILNFSIYYINEVKL